MDINNFLEESYEANEQYDYRMLILKISSVTASCKS
jgi:hypothetical protein